MMLMLKLLLQMIDLNNTIDRSITSFTRQQTSVNDILNMMLIKRFTLMATRLQKKLVITVFVNIETVNFLTLNIFNFYLCC